MTDLKYLALYLPQFHCFPENNAWWGEGFTEWSNVRPARPLFDGHYQPHIPSDDLGYYDLKNVDVMVKQAKMAREYGIHGFCYYYYWFNGKTLMEQPLRQMLETPEVDLPFCLCWANHNWTRRWDGMDQEVLIEQTYDESTYTRFIDDLAPYFRDKRYIKIRGRHLLVIYQADHLKNAHEVSKIWKDYAREKYGIDLYLVCAQQSSRVNPTEYYYDAAVDFTPKWRPEEILPSSQAPLLDPSQPNTLFFDYGRNTLNSILRPTENYTLFRSVYMLWDNSPRRKNGGANILLNATPEHFWHFLINISNHACQELDEDERFVFINAWNEWAEGTHLEPCKKYGYRFLEICREVRSMNAGQLKEASYSPQTRQWLNTLTQNTAVPAQNTPPPADEDTVHIRRKDLLSIKIKRDKRLKIITEKKIRSNRQPQKKLKEKLFEKLSAWNMRLKCYCIDMDSPAYLKKQTVKSIKNNRKQFSLLLQKAQSESSLKDKLFGLSQAALHASYKTCDLYSSWALEKELLDIAETLPAPEKTDITPHSVLHVMTTSYHAGGHTQVVRRWIENSPSAQSHSVVLIDKHEDDSHIPDSLQKVIRDKKGKLILIDRQKNFLEKAVELRNIASGFEKIILHTHMEDIVPILAFGSTKFTRPIALFNHADHLFWLGVSISDIVVNFRDYSTSFSETERKTTRNYQLPLPIDEPGSHPCDLKIQDNLRRALNISDKNKVIMTVASSYKYTEFGGFDFMQTAAPILDRVPEAILIVIGPDKRETYWNCWMGKYPGRIHVLGLIPFERLIDYTRLADLALDSVPVSSFVSLMDLAKNNVEALTLDTPLNKMDSFESAGIVCKTPDELIERAVQTLTNPEETEKKLTRILEQNHYPIPFARHLETLCSHFPEVHEIHPFKDSRPRTNPLDLSIFMQESNDANCRFNNQ